MGPAPSSWVAGRIDQISPQPHPQHYVTKAKCDVPHICALEVRKNLVQCWQKKKEQKVQTAKMVRPARFWLPPMPAWPSWQRSEEEVLRRASYMTHKSRKNRRSAEPHEHTNFMHLRRRAATRSHSTKRLPNVQNRTYKVSKNYRATWSHEYYTTTQKNCHKSPLHKKIAKGAKDII